MTDTDKELKLNGMEVRRESEKPVPPPVCPHCGQRLDAEALFRTVNAFLGRSFGFTPK